MATCKCGAKGDPAELAEHCVTALDAPDDARVHGWRGEPEQVKAARARRKTADDTRRKLADAAGVTVAELREALR